MSRHRIAPDTNPGFHASALMTRYRATHDRTEAITLPIAEPSRRRLSLPKLRLPRLNFRKPNVTRYLPALHAHLIELVIALLVAFVGVEVLCHTYGLAWVVLIGVVLIGASAIFLADIARLVQKESK